MICDLLTIPSKMKVYFGLSKIVFLVMAYYVHRNYKNYYIEKEQKLIEENNLLLEIKELEWCSKILL